MHHIAFDDDGDPLVAVLETYTAFFLLKGIGLGGEERGHADNVVIVLILVFVHIGICKVTPEYLLV